MRFLSFLAIALFIPGLAFADDDLDCQVVAEAINPTELQATDDYINLTDGTFDTTAAAEDEFIVPNDVVVWGIRADVDVAPGASDEWQVVVVDDGTETRVECAITGTGTSCANTDPSDRVTVAAGSDLTVLVDGDNGAGDPAAAGELRVAFCISKKR